MIDQHARADELRSELESAAAEYLGLPERAAHYEARYKRAGEEERRYIDRLFDEIEAVVGSECSVQEGMSKVIDVCSQAIPHPWWDLFRDPEHLDYDYDLPYRSRLPYDPASPPFDEEGRAECPSGVRVCEGSVRRSYAVR